MKTGTGEQITGNENKINGRNKKNKKRMYCRYGHLVSYCGWHGLDITVPCDDMSNPVPLRCIVRFNFHSKFSSKEYKFSCFGSGPYATLQRCADCEAHCTLRIVMVVTLQYSWKWNSNFCMGRWGLNVLQRVWTVNGSAALDSRS
jgi:hypothetical protein